MTTRLDGERDPLVVEVIVVKRAHPFVEPEVTELASRAEESVTPRQDRAPSARPPGAVHVERHYLSIESAALADAERSVQPPGSHPVLMALCALLTLLVVVLLGGTGLVSIPEPVQSEAGLGLSILALFLGSHAVQAWMHGS